MDYNRCRPLKIYYCPPRPGDKWPPVSHNKGVGQGAGAVSAGGSSGAPPRREATPKPAGCKKLYAGNLSYNIDDDTIVDFFKECGTIVGLRWLTHQSSGEFRVGVRLRCSFNDAISISIYSMCSSRCCFLLSCCRDVASWNLALLKRPIEQSNLMAKSS
jgi:hypothetical protein